MAALSGNKSIVTSNAPSLFHLAKLIPAQMNGLLEWTLDGPGDLIINFARTQRVLALYTNKAQSTKQHMSHHINSSVHAQEG